MSGSEPFLGLPFLNIDITSSLRRALWETLIGNQQLVLDIGCGDGQITGYLAEHSKRVFGLDPDIRIIEKAQKSNIQKNLHLLVCRAEALCFGRMEKRCQIFEFDSLSICSRSR